jgi:hypothetical protein
MRQFYLATQKDRSSEANHTASFLEARGWTRTFAWREVEPHEYAATALAELDAVRRADVLLVMLPGGYGTHVEIGAALALRIPVVIQCDRHTLANPYPCVFHYHPGVRLLVSEVLDANTVADAMEEAFRSRAQ